MIRAVLFDLDRTLFDRDRSFAVFATSQYHRFQNLWPDLSESEYVNRLIQLDNEGHTAKEIVYPQLLQELSINTVSWETLFSDFDSRVTDYYLPFPNLSETLTELSKHYALGLITNGRGEFQQRTISRLQLNPYFQVILISEIEGIRKPDPEIFHRALRKLEIPPAEAVYIGDNPIADIQGAKSAGLKTLWKRSGSDQKTEADASFDSLNEIPSLLKSIDR